MGILTLFAGEKFKIKKKLHLLKYGNKKNLQLEGYKIMVK